MKGRGSKYSLCLVNYSLSRDYSRLPSYNKTSPIRFLFLPWDVINPFDTLFKEMFSRQVPRQIYFHWSRCPWDTIYSWLPNWFVFLIFISQWTNKKDKAGKSARQPKANAKMPLFSGRFYEVQLHWTKLKLEPFHFCFFSFHKFFQINFYFVYLEMWSLKDWSTGCLAKKREFILQSAFWQSGV